MDNSFETLRLLNVNENTEKKGALTYLSWAWAWTEFKKIFPNAMYSVKKNANGLPYFESELGIMVYTEVTADNLTYEMWLPVMDFKNSPLKMDKATMFDINKTLMRCLTKNLAMFGLGLYIYAGEDLPEIEAKPITPELLEKLKELNISLEKVAVAYKCNISEVTADHLIEAIARQETAMQKVALKKKAELLEKEQVNESII